MASATSGVVSKTLSILQDGGVRGLSWRAFSFIYKNKIRPLLPIDSVIKYSGVTIGHRIVGDKFITSKLCNPPRIVDIDGYEETLISALDANVNDGDTVVVVGGGVGVTVIRAAMACGMHGRVICYEGDLEGVRSVLTTATLNGLEDRISVHHAIVGEDIWVYGLSKAGAVVNPANIPECDVLELDCEGAEIGVLLGMTITPRFIAVETHGLLGAPTARVREVLASIGYKVEDLGWAEPRLSEICEKNDIRVLVGTRVHCG